MTPEDEIERIFDDSQEVLERAQDQRRRADEWAHEILPSALRHLVPFLKVKLDALDPPHTVTVHAGGEQPGIEIGPARLVFTLCPGPPLGTAGQIPSLEVLAAVLSDVPHLATPRLAQVPIDDASSVWVQQEVFACLRRIAPHLLKRPQ